MILPAGLKFDEIGYWSEIKLDIIREYAAAYSKIMAKRRNPTLHHSYIDAFAGSGHNISRTTGELVAGSPTNALRVSPPFRAYYLIDLCDEKVSALKSACGERSDVHIWGGDCNDILLREVFPRVRFADYRRGLCLLDPYGLHLKWDVIQAAGRMESIDMFLNFPVADINRNVLWRNPEGVDPADIERMNAFWGDDSWRNLAYTRDRNLFGFEEKTDNQTVADGFAERLKRAGGFAHVATPLPMTNSRGAVVYYLFFASPKPVAQEIVDGIFEKYRARMA
ncbi:MAG: three-Cys-motif partner protein TcmP [Terriglobia bacterium]|jgi:three-Cys-motif partner protein